MSYEAIWLILSGICFIAEIFTVSFLLFLPGLAAFISFLLALFNASLTVQIISFVITTILFVVFVRPLICKLFKDNTILTNSESLVGKVGTTLKNINKDIEPGLVKVAGEIWTAITEEEKIIEKDELVVVLGINGVKLLVKKYKEEEE